MPSRKQDDLLVNIFCKIDSGFFFKPDCLNMRCKDCDPKNIWNLVRKDELDMEVLLKQWEMKKVMIKGKLLKKKVLTKKFYTVREVVEKEEDLKTFPLHDFHARWQYKMFNYKKKNINEREVVAVLDFAENYRCSLKDEAQSAYWNYNQATIHPIVCYYLCPKCCGHVTESIIIISDDLNHDSAAVNVFTKAAYEYLQTKLEIIFFLQFTDGCSAQYKSKAPFRDIQLSEQIIGVPIERAYFGSRHGKNPSDGESAVVKNAVTRAVKNRQTIIQTARDLYSYGETFLEKGQDDDAKCRHFKRKFIFIDEERIKDMR